jgi:hypothetical protein
MSTWTIGQEVLRCRHRADKQPTRYRIAQIERAITKDVIILSNGDRFWENGIKIGDLKVIAPSYIEALHETNTPPAPVLANE